MNSSLFITENHDFGWKQKSYLTQKILSYGIWIWKFLKFEAETEAEILFTILAETKTMRIGEVAVFLIK